MKWKNLLATALIPLLCACGKDEEDALRRHYDKGYDTKVSHDELVLGEKLEDPYTVANMEKAIESLYPTKAGRVRLEATDLYVRFLPKSQEDIDRLEALGADLYDHPFDYAVVREGDWYHDPSLAEDAITWQYAVVPPDFAFPKDIVSEVLDECYLADNLPVTRASDGIDWEAVERESFRLTGNEALLEPQTKADRNKPSGRITIVDEAYAGGKPFGVAGVRVSCNVFVRFAKAYTDRDGYYSIGKSFSMKPRYRLVFKNAKGFAIGLNTILYPASFSTLGRGSSSGVSVLVDRHSDSRLFRRCVVNNAGYDYLTRCGEEDMNITRPPKDLRIWIFKNLPASSAVMIHHGAVLGQSLVSNFLGNYVSVLKYFAPDITLGTKGRTDYASLYSVTVHELAHASHFARVGTDYWDRYIRYVVSSFVDTGGVSYGDGSGKDAGYCEVGEMWAYYLQSMMYKDRYGGAAPAFGTGFWFYPQVFRYLEERGFTRSQLIAALNKDVTSRSKLRSELVRLYPDRATLIEQVFDRYGSGR